MKVVTSATLHTTSEGQRISYTYSEVNEDTGAVIKDNVRGNLVVMDLPANKDILAHIQGVREYVQSKMEAAE